jgi:hypothetical protein
MLRAFLRECSARHGIMPEGFIDFHAGRASEPDWLAVDAETWQHAIDDARALTRVHPPSQGYCLQKGTLVPAG